MLNNKISKLEEIYLTNNDLDEESNNKSIDNEIYNKTSKLLAVYIDNFFTAKQIEHFYKMYVLYPMRTVAKDKKTHNKRLDKWDDDAFLVKFQEMKVLIQSELNLCFLGIIDTSMHATKFKDGTQKVFAQDWRLSQSQEMIANNYAELIKLL
ncbi:6730_t:CDS:2, partial [Gigaspora margarita]